MPSVEIAPTAAGAYDFLKWLVLSSLLKGCGSNAIACCEVVAELPWVPYVVAMVITSSDCS